MRYLQNNKKTFWMLTIILIAGIFLRTYNFSQWLRFNDDQARDARLASIFVVNHAWPLLGPRAAQTDFKLGAAYYYFQNFAALVFGASPVALTLPDLFFSVLTILLLYFFLKKYFEQNISLMLVTLFSVSYYVVYYSRFAWNPNSLPFFALAFLYALHETLSTKQNKKFFWALICGASLGIGIQLHTVFLVSAPIVLLIVFAFAFKKKKINWKLASAVIAMTVILNAPQIYSEIINHGKNTKAFFQSQTKESLKSKTILQNIAQDASCNFRQNATIISSFGQTIQCSSFGLVNPFARVKTGNMNWLGVIQWFLGVIVTTIFSIGGYLLWGYFLLREKDADKKNFLALVSLYSLVVFVIFIPLAFGVPERFFLTIEFSAFILLGFWLKFVGEKFAKGKILIWVILILLLVGNLFSISQAAERYAGKNLQNLSAPQEVTSSEVQFFAEYILAHANNAKSISFLDESSEVFGMSRSLAYFTNRDNIEVQLVTNLRPPQIGEPLFVLTLRNQKPFLDNLQTFSQIGSASFGRFTLYEFQIR